MPGTQTWTREQIDQIHPVYRDFMLALREVVDSESRPIKVTGVPWGQILTALRIMGHPFDPVAVADTLEQQGLVEHDELGFYRPTAKGKSLIRQLTEEVRLQDAPPFPSL